MLPLEGVGVVFGLLIDAVKQRFPMKVTVLNS